MSSSIRLFSPLPAKDCAARLQRLLDASAGGSPRPPVEVLSVTPTGARLRVRGRFLSSRMRLKFVPTPNGTRLIGVPRFRLLRLLFVPAYLLAIWIAARNPGKYPVVLPAMILLFVALQFLPAACKRMRIFSGIPARDFLIEALGITGIVSSPELLYPSAPPEPPQPSRAPVPEIDDTLPSAPIRRDGIPPARPADDLPPIRGRR